MISVDDDMRPFAYMEESVETLAENEVCRGKLFKAGENGYVRKSFDLVAAFLDELSVSFDYDGAVSPEDAHEILDKIETLHARVERAATEASSAERASALRVFAANLKKWFYGFEPDFFQQNLLRIVDDVLTVIKGSMELWPTLVEIAFFEKARRGLPELRVANQRR